MKLKTTHSISIVFLYAMNFLGARAQQQPLAQRAYGVWDRSAAFNISIDTAYRYLKGIEADIKWSDIQPADSSHFVWSSIQSIIKNASANQQLITVSIDVGPDAPQWIYNNGVPGVTTNDTQHPGWTQYPFYLDADYKRYYYRLIDSLSAYLRTQPSNIFNLIAWVQVKTGCTGDEVAYKGNPMNSNYTISNGAWITFRLNAFDKFRIDFNTGSSNKIALEFNNIDPISNPTEWQWVQSNINYGFGLKGSAYARGHHLTGEYDFKNIWTPYLINPQGLELFSTQEMDQSWTWPLYQINIPLGFYWGALSGLNTGLSVWKVTQGALIEAQNKPELHSIFKMFNKYAGQIFPATTTVAYSIFHEGLNAEDTIKFPVSIYGDASQSNQARYIAICNAYTARGAHMDDVSAALQGQVYQRKSQTGYNDAGWNIEKGNYERWLTQINPDSTSIGLFRVRGTIDSTSSMYDRFARSFEYNTGKNTMYFKFHQNLFSQAAPDSLIFHITWLDKNANSKWQLNYYTSSGLQTALNVTGVGDKQWKTVSVTLHNPLINQSGALGCDFMLANIDNIDDTFHGIEVDITRKVTMTSVESLHTYSQMKVYPNPTSSIVYWNEKIKASEVVIYDILGTMVFKTIKQESDSLDISDLKCGIYLIQLKKDGAILETFKIIRE